MSEMVKNVSMPKVDESKVEQLKKGWKKILPMVVGVLLLWTAIWGYGGYMATENALHHANVSRNQVAFIRFNLDLDDFIPQYEVSWYEGNRETEVTVHAFTGQLMDIDYD